LSQEAQTFLEIDQEFGYWCTRMRVYKLFLILVDCETWCE